MIREKWPYLLAILFLVGIGFAYLKCQPQKATTNWQTEASVDQPKQAKSISKEKQPQQGEVNNDEEIIVDIKGAIIHPGVYRMKQGDRVVDVVKKAGGLGKKADQTQVNLAKKLTDEMMIYIPKKGETMPPSISMTNSMTGGDEKININTATEQELEQLPGIGPSKAGAIIEYRKKNGPFQTVNDLDNVSGIGEKSVERMKSQVTVR